MGGGLSDKRCTWPCDPSIPAYTHAEALDLISRELSSSAGSTGWRVGTLVDRITVPSNHEQPTADTSETTALRLVRRVTLPDFASACALAQKIAGVAEAEGHFPDVQFGWQYVEVRSIEILASMFTNQHILFC